METSTTPDRYAITNTSVTGQVGSWFAENPVRYTGPAISGKVCAFSTNDPVVDATFAIA